MPKRYTVLFLLFVSHLTPAQNPTSADVQPLVVATGKTPTQTAVLVGRQLLGKPYVPHTLDVNQTEQLVVNLREFDCTTYLETVLALTLAHHDVQGKTNATALLEPAFRRFLTQLRYRNGKIDGFASRLHYFSDWLYDNERKGLLTDISRELPGSMSVAKPVTYMTATTWKYPALSDPAVLKQMALTEASLSQQPFAFVPSKHVRQAEASLREGDIIMLTAARPGLDMKHVGLAVRQPNGRMHLLHASSEQGRVVITPYPISEYVLRNKRLSGIRVARLRGTPTGLATAFMKGD